MEHILLNISIKLLLFIKLSFVRNLSLPTPKKKKNVINIISSLSERNFSHFSLAQNALLVFVVAQEGFENEDYFFLIWNFF